MKKIYFLSTFNIFIISLTGFVSFFYIKGKIQFGTSFYDTFASIGSLTPVLLGITLTYGLSLFLNNAFFIRVLSKNLDLIDLDSNKRWFIISTLLFIIFLILIVSTYFDFLYKSGVPKF